MANTVTAFLETLVATSGDYNAAKVGNLQFLDAVYLDVKPEVARAGKTIQVYFPDVGAFSDQQANDWTPEDINPSYVDLVFNQRPGKAILIRDFEQWQTAVDIIDKFIDPMYKRGLEYFNGQIAAQITEANFNTYAPLTGTIPGEVSVADAATAWGTLAGNKVPVTDRGDLSILTHSDVHQHMMTDKDWYQESLVGAVIAAGARERADLGAAFNFMKRWDQQAPRGGTHTGTVAGSGTTTVTGTSTHFTTELEPGDRFTIATDATAYVVAAIGSDTSLTTTAAVGTYSGKAITGVGYTCVALHKYAIGLAVRPLELVNSGEYIQSRIVMLRGIPFRVMLSYQHLKSGWLLSIDCGCAVKVLRPDFGVIIKC